MKSLLSILAVGFVCLPLCAQDPKTPPAKDAKEPAKEQAAKGYAVGSVAADFTLNDLDGKAVSLKKVAEGKKYIVIDFWSTSCPFAKAAEPAFAKLNADYSAKSVTFLHIASNKRENKDQADLTATKEYVQKNKIAIPVLLDVENKIADVFNARATPHVFILDAKDLKVVYEGSINDDPMGKNMTKDYTRDALEALLAGKAVPTPTTTPKGCTIKRVSA
jgi:thiol-disulfide isomerase/thioredoxin